MTRWQAIIFDLDDTLYPERDFVMSGFRAVAAWAEEHLKIPRQEGFPQLCKLFEGRDRGDTFDCWLISQGLNPRQWVPQMVLVYREHDPQISLASETKMLLQRLSRQYRLGLLTDGCWKVQENKVSALGVNSFIKEVLYTDRLGKKCWKPCVRPFEMILSSLKVPARQAVYIGDNPTKDFVGARQLGMGTVRIRRPEGIYSKLEPPSADHVPDIEISNLCHLEKMLPVLEYSEATMPLELGKGI